MRERVSQSLYIGLVVAAGLTGFERSAQARTSADAIATYGAEKGVRAHGAPVAVASSGVAIGSRAEGIARFIVCHISRHPKAGIHMTERVCPLIFASAEAPSPGREDD